MHDELPMVNWKNRKTSARKVIYSNKGNLIPKGHLLYTLCKINTCVNPDHLYTSPVKNSKVSPDKIIEIRHKRFSLNWKYRDIAEVYNIAEGVARNIALGISHSHIKEGMPQEEDFNTTCNNCSKNHDNIGADYCSVQCMQEYLTK